MSIGKRIKEEREHLGYTQEAFAFGGGVSKRSQIMYEQDKTEASATYFTLIAKLGADVLYILTGVRVAQSSMKIAKMAELMDGLSDDAQSEIYAVVAEKKRFIELENTVYQLTRKAG